MNITKRRSTILASLSLVIWRLWPLPFVFTGLNLRAGADFSQLDDFLPPADKPVVVYPGRSHPYFKSGQLFNEIVFKPRKMIYGHVFQPSEVKGTTIDEIATLLANPASYTRWINSFKACGGFHADYYFSWKNGTEEWEVILCTGCNEALLFHDGRSLRCDLSIEAGKKIYELEKNEVR